MKDTNNPKNSRISRRRVLKAAAGAGAGGLMAMTSPAFGVEEQAKKTAVTKGRINQSVAYWCYQKYWDLEKTCQVAKQLGCKSVEIVEPEQWHILKKYDLVCGMTISHWFDKGMNNPKYQEMCLDKIRKTIDVCADAGFPNVITFTGPREDISDDDGIKNCVSGYKKVIGYAEEKKINLCLENINSRINIDMVGVPGYQGDHVDYCMEIIRQVGSPRMKLLFDIFHAQVMDGDIIQRIRQYKDYIGHYHTAGNPGRHELDDKQEINYKPIMEEIANTGFTGYVGHEFMPSRDPLEGLTEAVTLCDV